MQKEPRDQIVQVRVTASDKRALKARAEALGDTVSNLFYDRLPVILGKEIAPSPVDVPLPDFLQD